MYRRAVKRFMKNRAAMIALIIFVIMLAGCIIFPMLGYNDFSSLDLTSQYAPVSLAHPFRTDHLGRDMFSRMMVGGRYTLGLSFVSTVIALTIGTLLGILAGYKGGWLDQLIVRITEAVSAIPYILIVIIMEVSLGWGQGYFSIAVGIAGIPAVCRNVRAAVLQVRHQEFIAASKALGKNDGYIIFRHILHNIYATVLVQLCSTYNSSIVACSILGYLEVGISSPTPEWGRMVADYFHLIQVRPFLVMTPCIFISLSVLCITMIAHGLRDALDPKEYQHE